jgi:hypothetical protein
MKYLIKHPLLSLLLVGAVILLVIVICLCWLNDLSRKVFGKEFMAKPLPDEAL